MCNTKPEAATLPGPNRRVMRVVRRRRASHYRRRRSGTQPRVRYNRSVYNVNAPPEPASRIELFLLVLAMLFQDWVLLGNVFHPGTLNNDTRRVKSKTRLKSWEPKSAGPSSRLARAWPRASVIHASCLPHAADTLAAGRLHADGLHASGWRSWTAHTPVAGARRRASTVRSSEGVNPPAMWCWGWRAVDG